MAALSVIFAHIHSRATTKPIFERKREKLILLSSPHDHFFLRFFTPEVFTIKYNSSAVQFQESYLGKNYWRHFSKLKNHTKNRKSSLTIQKVLLTFSVIYGNRSFHLFTPNFCTFRQFPGRSPDRLETIFLGTNLTPLNIAWLIKTIWPLLRTCLVFWLEKLPKSCFWGLESFFGTNHTLFSRRWDIKRSGHRW